MTETDYDTEPTLANDPPALARLEHRDRPTVRIPRPAASPTHPAPKREMVEAVPPRLLAAGVGIAAAMAVVAAWAAYGAWTGSGEGILIIRTEPVGARVFLDGKETGQTTPALLKDVEVGVPHKVRVEHPGRGSVEEIVSIPSRGATETLKLELR